MGHCEMCKSARFDPKTMLLLFGQFQIPTIVSSESQRRAGSDLWSLNPGVHSRGFGENETKKQPNCFIVKGLLELIVQKPMIIKNKTEKTFIHKKAVQ